MRALPTAAAFLTTLGAWCSSVPARGADQPALDLAQPSRAEKSHPVRYAVDFRAVVTPPYNTKLLRVWLMTLHSFKPDQPVVYPFTDLKSLEKELR